MSVPAAFSITSYLLIKSINKEDNKGREDYEGVFIKTIIPLHKHYAGKEYSILSTTKYQYVNWYMIMRYDERLYERLRF